MGEQKKPVVRLEGWAVFEVDGDARVLSGRVFGHERFGDGLQVTTSKVVTEQPVFMKGSQVETKNTFYMLGEPLDPVEVKQRRLDRAQGILEKYGYTVTPPKEAQ